MMPFWWACCTAGGNENEAHAAFADLFLELVGADLRAEAFAGGGGVNRGDARRGLQEAAAGAEMGVDQPFHAVAQVGLFAARFGDEVGAGLTRRVSAAESRTATTRVIGMGIEVVGDAFRIASALAVLLRP
jgi:dihydroxyacetone kinase